MHDTGNITFLNREFRFEVDPIFAANVFYDTHDNEYDAIVLFTTFATQLTGGDFLAYYLTAANDVTGLGYTYTLQNETFDNSEAYTREAPGNAFRGFMHMNRIGGYPDQPDAPFTTHYTPLELLGHEIGHRWLARIWLDVPGTGPYPVLLGRQFAHWSFIAHVPGSPMEGNAWEPLHVGRRWVSVAAPITYSPLDLYLMGMIPAHEVDASTLYYLDRIENLDPPADQYGNPWTVGSDPTPDVLCDAPAVPFTIDQVT
ncbi:MAG TPA: hypothetical protein VIZ30_00535, partial [Pseudomonadales bacterium]